MKKQCVQYEVGTTYKILFGKKLCCACSRFQFVGRQLLAAETGVRSRTNKCEIYCRQNDTHTELLPSVPTFCFFVRVIPPSHHIHLHNNIALVRYRSGRNPRKKQSSFGCRGALNRKVLSYC